MANGNIEVKMKLSPTQAGRLFIRKCELEDENKKLKSAAEELKSSIRNLIKECSETAEDNFVIGLAESLIKS